MSDPIHWKIRWEEISPALLEIIGREIANDHIVILPTDTVYGLHASAIRSQATNGIYALKRRERQKPLLVLASSLDDIDAIGAALSESIRAALQAIWPAPLTAIIPLQKPLAAAGMSSSVAVRIPAVPWLRDLLQITGPLASTSLNISGKPGVYSMEDLDPEMKRGVAAILDVGVLKEQPSTIVDFTGLTPRVIRQGQFRFTQELWKTLRKTL